MANSSLSLTSLDFDGVKNNLKTYLKSQSTFKDYDFEGSNMNVLLDILSYNTYMNAFYLNMTAAEGFLDSAQMRSSVVSHAKELNYTPKSAKSAKAVVNISINVSAGDTNIIEIPKGTQFSGSNPKGSFVFTTDQTHTLSSKSNIFTLDNLELYEGTYINETFVVDNSMRNQRFILSNKNIDTDSIVVKVYENNGLNTNDFIEAKNLYGLRNTSRIYFLQATLDGYYEVVFGDGTFGVIPQNNCTILVTYRITYGSAGNGVKSFRIDKDLGAFNSVTLKTTVSTVGVSTDGDEVESIDSIKFRAPKHYQTQDRAITNQDYVNIILENFPDVKSVNVYGGETLYGSAQYGRVFISPLSRSGAVITNSLKTDIITYINTRNSVAITPLIIDPNFLYLIPNITATVDFRQTSKTPAEIKTILIQSITEYNRRYLQNFNITFRNSKLITQLSNIDNSIVSIRMNIIAKKTTSPALGVAGPFSVTFNNALIPGTITSSQFVANDGKLYAFTDYNPNISSIIRTGDLNTYTVSSTNNILYLKEIIPSNPADGNYTIAGSVDYNLGTINVVAISIIDFLSDPGVVFKASPVNDDLSAIKNDLIEIDLASVNISVLSAS
jgi:hypothetical protein